MSANAKLAMLTEEVTMKIGDEGKSEAKGVEIQQVASDIKDVTKVITHTEEQMIEIGDETAGKLEAKQAGNELTATTGEVIQEHACSTASVTKPSAALTGVLKLMKLRQRVRQASWSQSGLTRGPVMLA